MCPIMCLYVYIYISCTAPDPVVFDPPCLSPSQITVTWKASIGPATFHVTILPPICMQLPAPVAPDTPIGQEATITCTGPGCIVATSTATSTILVGVVKNGTYTVGVALRNCVGSGRVAITNNIGRPQLVVCFFRM